MASGHGGYKLLLGQPFLLSSKEASFWAETSSFGVGYLPLRAVRGWCWLPAPPGEKNPSPPPARPPPTVLTVRDQGDVLGVGAQEVLHGAPQEQGLVHAVQLQGAVHPVHLQLRVVRGVGLQADLCRVVPQQPGGLPLGAAPGRGRIKAPKRQPDPCTTMGCNKLIDYFNKCEIIEVPVGFICPLTI